MADRYWVGASTGATATWNTTASWSTSSGGSSGASVPGSGDNAIFDGAGGFVGGCVVDAAISIVNLTLGSGYTGAGANDGRFDNATNDQAIGVSGDCICDNKRVDMGDATWTVGGSFDNKDVGTFNRDNGTLVLTSATCALTSAATKILGHVTIAAGATVTLSATNARSIGTTTVDGTLSISVGRIYQWETITVAATGIVTGSGTMAGFAGNCTISSMAGTWNVAATNAIRIVSIASGTYDTNLTLTKDANGTSHAITFGAAVIVTGDVTIQWQSGTGSFTVANNTNNPELTLRGDLSLVETAGTITWTKGTGTITFSGAADQDIDFAGKTIEDIEIDKSAGTLTLTDNLTTDTLTLTDGTLDVDGNTLTSSGAVSGAIGFAVQDTAGGGEIVCTDINYSGTSWDDAALSASGSTRTFHDCTITGSDASGSAGAIDATDNCVDGTENTNYTFAVPSGIALQMQYYQRTYGGVLSV